MTIALAKLTLIKYRKAGNLSSIYSFKRLKHVCIQIFKAAFSIGLMSGDGTFWPFHSFHFSDANPVPCLKKVRQLSICLSLNSDAHPLERSKSIVCSWQATWYRFRTHSTWRVRAGVRVVVCAHTHCAPPRHKTVQMANGAAILSFRTLSVVKNLKAPFCSQVSHWLLIVHFDLFVCANKMKLNLWLTLAV